MGISFNVKFRYIWVRARARGDPQAGMREVKQLFQAAAISSYKMSYCIAL